MMPNAYLTFNNGYLRPLNQDDVHTDYVDGLNDPDVNHYLDGVKRTKQTKQSVIEFVMNNYNSSNSILWGIWQDSAKHHCGTVRIHGIDKYHGTAHIGVCLFDKVAWGKHMGSKAIAVVTEWALVHLNLRWIEAGVYEENASSQKAFIGAGYDWAYDVCGKYILDGRPAVVKIYVVRKILN